MAVRNTETVKEQAAKKAERLRHEKAKAKVFEFEKRNRSKLVFYRSNGGWFKLGGVSALIYYHQVAKQIGAKPRLKVDTDYYSKFADGVISIKDMDKLEVKLKVIGVVRSKELTDPQDEIRMFDLGFTIDDAELKRLRRLEDDRLQELNKMVQPKVMMPELYAKLRELVRMTYHQMWRDDARTREYLSMEMARRAEGMLRTYLLMANGHEEKATALQTVRREADVILGNLKALEEVRAYQVTVCTKIGVVLTEVKRMAHK